MRIFNIKDAEGDVETFFGPSDPENAANYLYVKWLKQVWLKHLFKQDPAWVFPITVKRLPSFFKSTKPTQPQLEVQVTGRAPERIFPQSEWDVKDAENGTLFYYKPSQQTLFQYAPDLMLTRDYLRSEVFREKTAEFDVRKYNVPDTESKALKWHEELAERLRRQAEERRRQALANENNRYQHVKTALAAEEPLVLGVDYVPVKNFSMHGQEYVVSRLLTERSLYNETAAMMHCVWSYGPQLHDRVTVLLSIRKQEEPEVPIITVETQAVWRANAKSPALRTIQIQGYDNKDPDLTIKDIKLHWPSILGAIPTEHLNPLAPKSLIFKVQL
jgi:hypothetical protein